MIALAGLPNFAQTLYNPSFRSMLLSRATAFMLTTCTIAYVIKVFYFDVTDDGLQAPHGLLPIRPVLRNPANHTQTESPPQPREEAAHVQQLALDHDAHLDPGSS